MLVMVVAGRPRAEIVFKCIVRSASMYTYKTVEGGRAEGEGGRVFGKEEKVKMEGMKGGERGRVRRRIRWRE